jgi:hypothetical protein
MASRTYRVHYVRGTRGMVRLERNAVNRLPATQIEPTTRLDDVHHGGLVALGAPASPRQAGLRAFADAAARTRSARLAISRVASRTKDAGWRGHL